MPAETGPRTRYTVHLRVLSCRETREAWRPAQPHGAPGGLQQSGPGDRGEAAAAAARCPGPLTVTTATSPSLEDRFHSSTLKCLKTLRNGCCHTGGHGGVRCQTHRGSREGAGAGSARSPAVTASAARGLGSGRISAPTSPRRRRISGPTPRRPAPSPEPRAPGPPPARRYLRPWRRRSRFPPRPPRAPRRARSARLATAAWQQRHFRRHGGRARDRASGSGPDT